MGLSHNYYFGRNEADLTPWLEYFLSGLAEVYGEAAEIVRQKNSEMLKVEPDLIRRLDLQQRMLFRHLVFKQQSVSITEMCRLLDTGERTVREKVKKWIEEEFLEPKDPEAQRVRTIVLAPQYEELAADIRNEPGHFQYLLGSDD